MINIINYDKIIGFVYTEKSNKQISDSSKYSFWISKQCSKREVMSIIKKTYGVNVVKVNIINTPEKPKRFRGLENIKSSRKKAIITLEKGQTINFA